MRPRRPDPAWCPDVRLVERFVRWQQVSQAAFEQLRSRSLGETDVDEAFYAALRECLLAAGATDGDIDIMAAHFVTVAVGLWPEWDDRQAQFELIATYLACTDMVVRLGAGDSFIAVQFPDRPRVH
jgi:hypothetical protein